MDHLAPLALVLGIGVIALVVFGMRRTGGASAAPAGPATGRERMAADMRATRTSRVVDEVAILDELGGANPGFRQYCELVGTAQATGGVTAPYSRREVAYYEIRCYRIENRGSGDVETLVAHERSFDPFFFTDASCDTPVYVDLDSFGDDVILVNSTNHVEGPRSEFSRAADAAGGRGAAAGGTLSAIVGGAVRGAGMLAWCAGSLLGAARRALHAAARLGASALGGAWAPRPSLALAGGPTETVADENPATRRARLALAGPAGRRGPAPGGPGRPAGRSGSRQPRPDGPIGGFGMPGPGVPPGMGDFLGGMGGLGGFSGVPRPRPRRRAESGDVLVGMALGSLLTSLATGGGAGGGGQSADSFRGYRLVEDVVPLGSPVYCIGELYRSGTQVHMGRSLAADYPTSYFATRPEAELLSALGGTAGASPS